MHPLHVCKGSGTVSFDYVCLQVSKEQQSDIMLKQSRDVAYCLSQLSFSSAGPIKKFMDCFRLLSPLRIVAYIFISLSHACCFCQDHYQSLILILPTFSFYVSNVLFHFQFPFFIIRNVIPTIFFVMFVRCVDDLCVGSTATTWEIRRCTIASFLLQIKRKSSPSPRSSNLRSIRHSETMTNSIIYLMHASKCIRKTKRKGERKNKILPNDVLDC